ncbi:hypothetical protein ACLI1Q_002191 [Corynebacterium sp. LaCa191]|uniref:hypothetical protein n=1 Tax=Corynebacterium sp. LaCa191 TaxID=3391426 RepID=UPI00398984BF
MSKNNPSQEPESSPAAKAGSSPDAGPRAKAQEGTEKSKGKRIVMITIAIIAVIALVAGVTFSFNRPASSTNEAAEPAFSDLQESSAKNTPGPEEDESTATADDPAPQKQEEGASTKEESKEKNISTEEKCGSYYGEAIGQLHRPIQLHCDDSWLYVAESGTSHFSLFQWSGNGWDRLRPDGMIHPAEIACYTRSTLEEENVPEDLIEKIEPC